MDYIGGINNESQWTKLFLQCNFGIWRHFHEVQSYENLNIVETAQQIMNFDSDYVSFLCLLLSLSLSLSLRLIHTDTKIALFKFKGRGLAARADSLHRRTAETTDGHSSEGLLPHIRLSSSDPPFLTLHIPPSAFSPDPPLSPPRCGLQQTVVPNPHLPQQSTPSSSFSSSLSLPFYFTVLHLSCSPF